MTLSDKTALEKFCLFAIEQGFSTGHADTVDDLIAELSDQMVSQGRWRSIDTAPRDGTPVDLWHRAGFIEHELWWTDDDCWTSLRTDESYTHWMPIPPPPMSEETT